MTLRPRRRLTTLVYYLQENQARFPGVEVERVFVRRYPQGTLAAHLFGNVGEVSEEELKEPRYREPRARRRDRQGRGRVQYDRYLRGRAGRDPDPGRLARPAEGRAERRRAGPRRQPAADDRLRAAGGRRGGALLARACPAAFVAMDVHNGEILGDGLEPDLRPRRLHQADHPGRGRRALPTTPCGAADQPRDRRRLPDRLDLQADHRDRGAGRRRRSRPTRPITTTAPITLGGDHLPERRRRRLRVDLAAVRAAGLLRRLLLHARRPR